MKYRIWNIEWFNPVHWPEEMPENLPEEIPEVEIDTDTNDDVRYDISRWLTATYGDTTAAVRSFEYEPADPDTKVFTVCVKRTDALFVNVWAKTLDEAIKRVERRANCNDWFAAWRWDGETVEVSREDSHEALDEDVDF